MVVLSKFLQHSRLERTAGYIAGDVLDLGCAQARVLQHPDARIARYVGIDWNKRLLAEVRKRHPEHTFISLDVERDAPPFEEEFDVILMSAFVEHIFNQRSLYELCCRALRPSGCIVITTPTPFGNDIVHRIGAALGLFAKSAVDDHIVIYNRKRFEIAAEEFELELELHRRFQFGCNQLAILRKPVTQTGQAQRSAAR